MPLSGKGIIELQDGKEVKEMHERSFLAVPPGEVHRVRNTGKDGAEFVFLLAQSPRHQYDFIDDPKPQGTARPQAQRSVAGGTRWN